MGQLKELASAHDTNTAIENRCFDEKSAPRNEHQRDTAKNSKAQYTSIRHKSVGDLVMLVVWQKATLLDPLSSLLSCVLALPKLQAVPVKVKQLSVDNEGGGRSLSTSAISPSKLRTRVSYATHTKVLYMYFNSRVLPDRLEKPSRCSIKLAWTDVELTEVAYELGAEGNDKAEGSGEEECGANCPWKEASGGKESEDNLVERASRYLSSQSN